MSASPRCSIASSARRIAIVHDQPGVTRDRVTAEAEWHGHAFTLVDTGGIGLLRREKADDVIIKAALEQVELAIEAANVIILVVNVQEGVVPLDREVARAPAPQRQTGSGRRQQGGHQPRGKRTPTNSPNSASRKSSPSARFTARALKT